MGELLWYLKGTNRLDFIEYYISRYRQYSDDGEVIFGGYGPRIFGSDGNAQVLKIISLLRSKPDSRQAVVQIFDKTDLSAPHLDIPCTCTLQFMVRDGRLNLFASMRSNDAYMGLPHDVFAFTMIQELVARSLDLDLGHYKHFAGSLHLYDTDRSKAIEYLEEGGQPRVPMPPMPKGDPWGAVEELLNLEQQIRKNGKIVTPQVPLPSYWMDLIRLLEIHALTKSPGDVHQIFRLRHEMSSEVYGLYIRKKIRRHLGASGQLPIFDTLPA
ncbi:MAG: thymidylate synthase [Burkholderiaceae bacterium]|nr:thymidylate synthase [Burkholderiaceae bacterium]